jgi:hypothetical protein
MKKQLASLSFSSLLLAAAGCTTVDSHVRVEGWPDLKVVEHKVPYGEMHARCAKYAAPLMTPLGCTEFDFARGEADIYVTPHLATRAVLEHERLHAAGYDHPGSQHMQQLWQAWLAGHPDKPGERGVAASQLIP